MFQWFPFGKAPLTILMIGLVAGAVCLTMQATRDSRRPDLVIAIFSKSHAAAYKSVIDEFNRENQVNVQLQLVQQQALLSRLHSAMQTGCEVPDLVELLQGTLGHFTRGPLEDVGFVDLTDRLHGEGIYDRIVESRFRLWSSRGRIFALPHDVHPVGLCYRRDLIEQLGIDVSSLKTWADFVRMGHRVTADLDGDGVIDRYALDLTLTNVSAILLLAAQRGADLFDAEGNLTMDSDNMRETILWYVRQTIGGRRIAYPAGDGQNLAQAMTEGLVLFYFCPDWRTAQFAMDMPYFNGKLGLIPLPAWSEGGCRTSTSGGTGLLISKQCRNQDLAWKLAKRLYLEKKELGKRFLETSIIPPLKEAWDLPEFDQKNEFFGGIKVGRFYADLAPETPPRNSNAYAELAANKLLEVYIACGEYYRKNGETGLDGFARNVMDEKAGYVRKVIARNVFLTPQKASAGKEIRK